MGQNEMLDTLMIAHIKHAITPSAAETIPGLFCERVARTPETVAYRHFDLSSKVWVKTTWADMLHEAGRWQQALRREKLNPGDRVGVMLRNCREWVVFDQAALGLGLVTVPLYVDDRAENVAYIAEDADIKVLIVEGKRNWQSLINGNDSLASVKHIVCINTIEEEDKPNDNRLISLSDWIFGLESDYKNSGSSADGLATIVYTSGTTGRPKGVMLTHRNILSNAWSCLQSFTVEPEDVFLSFLPLSHMLERTVGYYLTMMVGSTVAFTRGISRLAEDLATIKPTVLVSVPRIYERFYGRVMSQLKSRPAFFQGLFNLTLKVGWKQFCRQQGRASWSPSLLLWPMLNRLVANKILKVMGGRLRVAICGGAPIPEEIAHLFVSLGLPLLQGYGLTEASPVVSVNRVNKNIPASIGQVLPGIQVRIGGNDELQTNSDSVMRGYWKNSEDTKHAFAEDGWLRTGDKAYIDDDGYIYITGRIKDILVLANGEKVPPADMEMAISLDPLFDQVLVVGEGRRFLTALLIVQPGEWNKFLKQLSLDGEEEELFLNKRVKKAVQQRISERIKSFPGYAQIKNVYLSKQPWTIDNGLITPTLKPKRAKILKALDSEVEALYQEKERAA